MNQAVQRELVSKYNERTRHTNIAMSTATSGEWTPDQRLDALRTALSHWPEGSPERRNIIDQVPGLYRMLGIPV